MISTRGAIELSINMLVIVIISLVVMGAGITLIYKFLGGSEDIKKALEGKTKSELERLLIGEGKQVAVAFQKAIIERGDSHIFGLGVLNIHPQSIEFTIVVDSPLFVSAEQPGGGVPAEELLSEYIIYDPTPFILEKNQHVKKAISVEIPPQYPEGIYIITVRIIQNDGMQYGAAQKLYVEAR